LRDIRRGEKQAGVSAGVLRVCRCGGDRDQGKYEEQRSDCPASSHEGWPSLQACIHVQMDDAGVLTVAVQAAFFPPALIMLVIPPAIIAYFERPIVSER
jgi:hypothetical protein